MTAGKIKKLPPIILVLCALTLVWSGCSRYHTRMFKRADARTSCRGDLCFTPRIVAFKDVFGNKPVIKEHGYWTALRIVDQSVGERRFEPTEEQQVLRDSLAVGFLRRTMERIRVDSAALHIQPGGAVVRAANDQTKFSPRDINFITFNFGKLDLPTDAQTCRAVFFLTLMDPAGNSSQVDSVEFNMVRVERHHRSQLVAQEREEDLRGY